MILAHWMQNVIIEKLSGIKTNLVFRKIKFFSFFRNADK